MPTNFNKQKNTLHPAKEEEERPKANSESETMRRGA